MEGDNFCTACGAELQPDSNFCPQCGRPLNGDAQRQQNPNFMMPPMPVNPPGSFFILMWGILGTVGGIVMAVMFFTMSEDSFDEYLEILEDYGLSSSIAYDDLWYYGVAYLSILISGILALASYVYCRRKTQWKPAVGLCILSSVVCLATVAVGSVDGAFCCLIGLMVTYMLYRGKSMFADGKERERRLRRARPPAGTGLLPPDIFFNGPSMGTHGGS